MLDNLEPIVGESQKPTKALCYAWLLLIPLIVLLDYLTKQYALSHLVLHEPVAVIPFFNFTLVYNTGAAFGFLSSLEPTWERWLLSGVSLLATAFFFQWYRQADNRLQRLGLALIMGGALGNFIDRAFYGFVIDFLDVYVGQYHWPAFNLADSAICVGVALLILSWVKYERCH
jgi:signal peptidase II